MTPPIVKRFLIAFEQHKLLGLLIFLLSLGISGIFAIQPEPPLPKTSYKVTGQLSYSTPPPLFTSTGEQLQQQGRQINVDVLLSPAVQAKIKDKLQLSTSQLKNIIDRELKINIPQEGEIPLISLEYQNAATPEEAIRTLGVFMTEMVEQSRAINTSQLRSRIEALESRLEEVQQKLATAEETFYRFITREGTSLLAIQDGSLFTSLTGSQQQQRQLKLVLEEIDGQINGIIKQLGLTPEQAYTASALSADPFLAGLRAQILDLETQKKQLEKDLRPEHPNMLTLQKQIDANEQLLQERAREVLGGNSKYDPLPSQLRQESSLDPARQQLANTLVTLQTQREGIQRQLNSLKNTEIELKQQYEVFPDRQLKQARLVQEIETKKALYQTILTALVDAQSAEAETTSSFAIAQAPVIQEITPTAYVPPNRTLILIAGAGIGILAANGIIFLLGMLDERLHTEQELQELLSDREVAILGNTPYVWQLDSKGEEIPILIGSDSEFLTFYERIRSNLSRYSAQEAKIILITSISRQEGKSVTAYNLAIASAQAGKRTLLIEADLHSPSNVDWVEVEPDANASIEPLKYYGDRNSAIRLVPKIANFYLVPSPGALRHVPAILESNELRNLIEDARGRFDTVIIDSPALAESNDALLLEPLTDGVVFVTQPGIAIGNLLEETIDRFSEMEIPILGAVINNLERKIPIQIQPIVATPTTEATEVPTHNNSQK
jgi:capsular exopolysaccharide synthesis family protein